MFTWMIQAHHIDGLVQDCSNSSALAMELLQSCTKPSIYSIVYRKIFHYSNQAVPLPLCIVNEAGWNYMEFPGADSFMHYCLIPAIVLLLFFFSHKDCIGINLVVNAPANFQHLALTLHQQSQCWQRRYCFLQSFSKLLMISNAFSWSDNIQDGKVVQ